MQNMIRKLTCFLAIGFMAFSTAVQADDTYPNKSIRIIVPTVPGGGLDLTTRLVADKMSQILGQAVVIENRPGADSVLGGRSVKDADPDGYTILAQSLSFVSTPLVKSDSGYHPLQDFRGIGRMTTFPVVISMAPQRPEQEFGELLDTAKKEPGKISYATTGQGSPSHLSIASLLMQSDVVMTPVPYKGIGQALPDVVGGRVDLVADGYNSSRSYISGGKLRPVAVAGTSRLTALPDVPTLKEQGFDFTYFIWLGMYAPIKTSDAVVNKLATALHQALQDPDLQARFAADGSMTVQETPAEFDAYIRAEYDAVGKVVASMGLVK